MDADDKLLTQLGAVLRTVDPVPWQVTMAARSAIAWRTIDAELAALLEDSAIDHHLVGTRGSDSGWRALTFESPNGVTIEVEVVLDGGGRTILGQVVPGASTDVTVRLGTREVAASSDELGRFRLEDIPAGPISLRIDHPDGPVETGWVTI
jgi:hypothetical protein